MAEIKLTREQQAVVDNRGGTLLVSAAAGSGKTKVLIDRVLKRVEEGSNVDDFLIITFTNAAAAELREKLIARLSECLAKEPDNRHLQQQMNRVYLAQISTVHGFCGTLLREYAHELDIPCDFRICDDQEAASMEERAMVDMLEKAYEDCSGDEEITEALNMLGAGRDDRRLPGMVSKIYRNVRCWRNPGKRLQELMDTLDISGCRDASETVWGAYLLREMHVFLDNWEPVLSRACSELAEDEALGKYLPAFQSDLEQLQKLQKLDTWDEFQQAAPKFARLATVKNAPDPEKQQRFKELRNRMKSQLKKKLEDFSDPSCVLLQDMELTGKALRGLLKLVKRFHQCYEEVKKRCRVLDYSDLEQDTLRLLYGSTGIRTGTAKEIAKRFTEIMVDEYQDTNGVQDAIFSAVSKGNNLFFVGDVKQSIYRFRLADPGIFLNKYKTYQNYEEAEEGEPRKILLSDNFRSYPEILAAANDVFYMNMTERVGGLNYGEPEALRANLPPQGGLPVELHCIDMENVSSDEHIDRIEVEAEFLAQRISHMLETGETVTTREGTKPIEPGDIAILLRSAARQGEVFVSALQRHGIRCDFGSEDLFQTEEIGLLTALLQVIDNPYQDIPLLTVLMSPLFCYTAEDLAQIRAEHPGAQLYDAVRSSEAGKRFTECLTALRKLAGQGSLHDLLDEIDERLSVRDIYADGAGNLDEFYGLVDRFEAGPAFGLSEFLKYAERLKAKGAGVKGEPKGNAVQILTMHKSKGLEFPVVFLADLYKRFNNMDSQERVLTDPELGVGASLFDVEKGWLYPTLARRAISERIRRENMSEEMRVLYVAMTRAQSRLIMTYCGTSMEKKLQDMARKVSIPASENAIESAQRMGDWVVMTALTHSEAGELFRDGVRPETCIVPEYPWKIAFHDGNDYLPGAATAEAEETERKAPMPLLQRHYPHEAATAAPSKLTATQMKGRNLDEEAAEEAASGPQLHFDRPDFERGTKPLTPTERGIAIHLAMQYLPYDRCSTEAEIGKELEHLVEKKQLTQKQADAVDPMKSLRFFRSEIGKRVLSAPHLEREFKFSVLEDGSILNEELKGEKILLQGVADCCILEEDGITILDFKSDRIQPGQEPERGKYYQGQLDAYSRALSRIFGIPVKERVLYFFATDTAWTSPL